MVVGVTRSREFVRIKEAELKAFSIKVKHELQWKNHFVDFDRLLELYAKKRKSEAPNSWQTDVYYLEQYVFNFFLSIKRSNNLNNWELRHAVLGRKNFAGSKAINGADVAATLYTVIESAKKCGNKPKDYMK